MYYSLLQYITGYNITLQSNILYLCTLQCVIVVYGMPQYIPMHYSVFQSKTMYYSF